MKDVRSEFFENKLILAPMVKMCTLPMRLLSIDYGADLVYCEELIDYKLLKCDRIINNVLKTVDYIDRTDGNIIFRTCAKERDKVILQIGTSDPDRASKIAALVENDVAGIDINMGCPKEFSVKGGMGVALLDDIEKACKILRSVITAVKIPVTCKIRVKPELEETVEICKKLEKTGIAAIAIHGRTKQERPRHSNRNYMLKVLSSELQIPVIANGGSNEIGRYSDIEKFRKETGCNSVMLARAAQYNCSIFRKEGKIQLQDIIHQYLRYAIDYDNPPSNTKYCVQNMLRELQETPLGQALLEAQTLEQICAVWNLKEYCRAKSNQFYSEGLCGRWTVVPESIKKKRKIDELENNDNVISMRCAFIRNLYPNDVDLPKTKLFTISKKQRKDPPSYETTQSDKLFTSIVTYNGHKYSSTYWEKNKRCAEQGAAIVCLCTIGIYNTDELIQSGIIK